MLPVLRWSCALSVAVAVAAPRSLHAEEPPPPPTDVETPPETLSPPSTTDSVHEEMVKSFVQHFQAGKVYYNKGQYALAAERFEQAFAAVPAEAALRNVALSRERAGDDVAAAIAARRYLDLPACDTPGVDKALCASHREELATALERLLDRVAELRLEIAEGVVVREIRINNRITAREDFPILVAPGPLDIEYSGVKSGQKRQRVIEVRAGEKVPLIVDGFDAPREPDPRLPPTGKPRPTGQWVKPAFFAGIGLTAASGIALATTGALAIVHRNRFEQQQQLFLENPPPIDDMGNVGDDPEFPYPREEELRAQRYKYASNVLVGVTAGLAVVTVVLAIVTYTRPKTSTTSRASTRTRFRVSGTGMTLEW